MTTKIFENYSAFVQRADKKMNGVSPEFAERHPNYEQMNNTNRGCSRCSYCSYCWDCSRCSYCSGKTGEKEEQFKVPVIKNVHSKILEVVSNPGALNMDNWHTCETTHCRAGWVVTLAGKEGEELERKTSTAFAAMQIYKESSQIKVSPVRFYEDNKTAMEDVKRCAEEESRLV